jgi:hypothetical protein
VLGLSVQPTTSTSTDVERVKAIVDSLVRKGVAYIVGLHAYLCNPFWPNIDDTLKPAFGEAVAEDVSSEVYSAFKGIDIYAKVKVEGVEVELEDYLRRYILGEHISKMILEEVEKRFNQMPEGEKRVLSVACAIINAVKDKDYPAFSVRESEGYLSIYSEDVEYFSKVVSSILGFEVPNLKSLFYKYLLGFQCNGASRRHVWFGLKIYPFVEAYIKKLASEAQRYTRIFNRREVEEKLNELYRNGDLLMLSVIHKMVYSRPTWESLNFLSYFKGVRYEDLCKWAKVEGVISDCFVNPLVYDYVRDVMKTLHDKALSELVESFGKVFERAGYESICVNECCTFTKALSKPIYMCFSPWPEEISVPYVPEAVKVVVIQGVPAQGILKYLQDRRREELWVFVEGDRIFIAPNTYRAEDHQEVVRVLSNRFSVNFIGPTPELPGRKPEESSGMPPRPLRRRAKDILEDVVAEVLESLGFRVRVDQKVQGRSGEIEVDVWGEKIIGDTRFIVYASCKNWDNPVDVGTVREEFGRILQMISIPNVWILVAPTFTDSARREAIANGFMVIEIGEKAHEGNVDRIYSKVYDKLDKLFTGVAPKRLQELAERVRELAERARRIAEEARRSAEEIEGIKDELERIASTRPPELPASPPPTSPKAPGSLDERFDELGVPNDLRSRAKRLLLHVYTTCYDLYVDSGDKEVVVGDEKAYLVLKQLNIVDLARNSRERSYEVVLKNKDVAASVAREHVESVRGDLRKLIGEYGWEVALIACVEGRSFRYESYGSFEPDLLEHESLPRRVTVAIGAVKPLLKERYLKFWEELEKLGLAFWCRGVRIPLPEAQKAIIEIIDDKLKEFSGREAVVKKLVVLNLLYRYFPMDSKNEQYFKSFINKLGFKLEDVLGDIAEIAEGLRRKGIVSGFTTTPPYMVVYDVNAFRKAIMEEIESLYNRQMR